MGVAHAFEQYVQVVSILAIKIANLSKTVICLGLGLLGLQPSAIFGSMIFSLFFINIWVYALFLRKAYHVDNEDWKTSCSNANMNCDLKFPGFFFFINIWVYALILRRAYHIDNENWKTSCTKANMYCDLKFLRKAFHVDNEDWKTSCSNANMYCDLKFAGFFFFLY